MSKKKEFSPLSLVLTLVVIASGSGILLAGIQELTRAPIEAARKQETLRALQEVMPAYANDPLADQQETTDGMVWYPGRDESGRLVGIAVPTSDDKGYGGDVKFMIGLSPQGAVSGVYGLQMAETPGLGDKIFKEDFIKQFLGKTEESMKWDLKKDGGDVDGLTAATISSRAATRAVHQAFEVFSQITPDQL